MDLMLQQDKLLRVIFIESLIKLLIQINTDDSSDEATRTDTDGGPRATSAEQVLEKIEESAEPKEDGEIKEHGSAAEAASGSPTDDPSAAADPPAAGGEETGTDEDTQTTVPPADE